MSYAHDIVFFPSYSISNQIQFGAGNRHAGCLPFVVLALHRGGLESAYSLLYCTGIAREGIERVYVEIGRGQVIFVVGPLHFFFGMFADMEKM